MYNQEKSHSENCFVMVDGEKVIVSKEVHTYLRQQMNHNRYLMRKEGRCLQNVFQMCSGDCDRCRWYRGRKTISIDSEVGRLMETFASETDVEAAAIEAVTISDILTFADSMLPMGGTILKMRFVACMSNKEIARALGTSPSTIDRRVNRLLKLLRRNSSLFFED